MSKYGARNDKQTPIDRSGVWAMTALVAMLAMVAMVATVFTVSGTSGYGSRSGSGYVSGYGSDR